MNFTYNLSVLSNDQIDKLFAIERFIDHYANDEEERDAMNRAAYLYMVDLNDSIRDET
jgi:hypothetical protein